MAEQKTKPAHMSDAQWQEQLLVEAVHDRAFQRGIGILQISARRYAVIRKNGSSASKRHGEQWFSYLNYAIVEGGDKLTWQQARDLVEGISAAMDSDARYQPSAKDWEYER